MNSSEWEIILKLDDSESWEKYSYIAGIRIRITDATAVYLSAEPDRKIYESIDSTWRSGHAAHQIKITARPYQTDGFGSSML